MLKVRLGFAAFLLVQEYVFVFAHELSTTGSDIPMNLGRSADLIAHAGASNRLGHGFGIDVLVLAASLDDEVFPACEIILVHVISPVCV